MVAMTVDDVRAKIPATVDLAALGLDVGDPDPLVDPVAIAQAQLPGIIGWTLANLPPALDPLAQRAITLLALKVATDLSPDRLETLADFDLLQSMSAGGYSETRRSADEALKLQKFGLTGWPGLDSILIGLMSPEKRDEFLALMMGTNAPAFAVTEPNWLGEWYPEYTPGWW